MRSEHQDDFLQALGTALQAQGSLEEEEWEVVKASSAQSCEAQPLDPALLKELGAEVAQEEEQALCTCTRFMHMTGLSRPKAHWVLPPGRCRGRC